MPAAAACLMAFILRVPSLSFAVAAGLLATLFLTLSMEGPLWLLFLWPTIMGGAVGAITTGLLLWLWPSASIWTRMSVAMASAVGAGMGLLFNALGGA